MNKDTTKQPTPTENPVITGEEAGITPTVTPTATEAPTPVEEPAAFFEGLALTKTYKPIGRHNPLIAQKFCADPAALVYNDRVYLYMSTDAFEYDKDGKLTENTFKNLKNVHVISSDDLVNWTDHGTIYVAGGNKAAKWAYNSYAPAAVCKEIDGEMKFFLYFANGGGGIGVLTSDSPTGPFKDVLGKALVLPSTPNCSDIVWLFDPAVFVDDDGTGYLCFGGGVPQGQAANPKTARIVKLGADMMSLDGDPVMIDAPYFFEDSGINKIGDTYYYSYCSNWNVTAEAKKELGLSNAQICYMTSENPMGPYTYQGVVLQNPGDFFGNHYNNHHSMFQFKDTWYIAYHTQLLENTMGYKKLYRSSHLDYVTVAEDGKLTAKGTYDGTKQLKYVNPYETVEAETLGTMAGINTTQVGKTAIWYGAGNMALTEIESGDWSCVYGVDFGEQAATSFTAAVCTGDNGSGVIQIRLDATDGEVVGYLELEAGSREEYTERSAELLKSVSGVHDLYFIYYGSDYRIDSWKFGK